MTDRAVTSSTRHDLPAPRGAVRLSLDRQFGAIFWGKLLGTLGIWIHTIVAAIVVHAATDSALWVGLVAVVKFTPQIFLTPISGTWADRGRIGLQIIVGRLLCALGSGSLAVFCFVRGDLDGYSDALVVLGMTLVTGLGFVVGGPAQQSVIPSLIRPGELSTAMALNSLPMTFGRVAGPVGGALVASQYSPAMAFAIAALTNFIFSILVLVAALPPGVERDADADYRIRAALSYVQRDRTMLLLLVVVAAVGFGSEPSITLAPPLAEDLGGGTQLVGQLTGAFGVGAVLGFFGYQLLGKSFSQQRVLQLGLAAMAVGTALVAFAPGEVTAMVAFAVAGVGFMAANTAAATLIQQRVPPMLRGRVMALWMVAFLGIRPLASVLQGFLADAVSLAAALLTTAGVLLVVLLAFRPKRLDISADG